MKSPARFVTDVNLDPDLELGETKADLLHQSCVFRHAVEDSSFGYEVCGSIKLRYLSLVQHQHPGRGQTRQLRHRFGNFHFVC